MRYPVLAVWLFVLGCGAQQAAPPPERRAEAKAPAPPPQETKPSPAGRPGSDWPGFLGPRSDSTSPEKGILSPWPEKGLRIVWFRRVGVGYGMPAVVGKHLYQFDRHGDKARLSCIDRLTGGEVWKFEYPTDYRDSFGYDSGPRCCPVVDGDRVYIHGAEGMLHCVRATDGKLLWKVDTFKQFNVVPNFFGVGSTPVVEGDLLIVQVGGSPKGSDPEDFQNLKGNGSGIVAFDKKTGKVKYQITDELASYASPVLATLGDRRWCFVFARGGLIGFEPATGKVDFHYAWRSPDLASVNAANPVVVGNRVFITETYGPGAALLEVKPGSCKEVWTDAKKRPRDRSLMCHWNTPIYHDGYVYGCSGRHPNNAELRCIELATGKVTWSVPRLTRTSLLMVDGHFICLGEDGTVRLLKVNPRKYEEVSVWEVKAPGKDTPLLDYPCWAAPVLAHGLLYLRGPEWLVCAELIPPAK